MFAPFPRALEGVHPDAQHALDHPGQQVDGGDIQDVPDGGLEVELQAIIGATNQLGFGRLSCREI